MTILLQPENVRANIVTMKLVELNGKIFSNQTGRFPVTSSKGNKYLMVMYDNDTNAILAEPMKNRSQQEIMQAQAVNPGDIQSLAGTPISRD